MNLVFKTFPDIRVDLSNFATKRFIIRSPANYWLNTNVKPGLVH